MFQPTSQTQAIQEGQLLIADPSLRGSVFNNSVVLLAQHSLDGAFGLILNQPTNSVVGDYLTEESFAELARIPVMNGGPVAKSHLTFAAFWLSPDKQLRYAIRISAEDAIARSKQSGTIVRAFAGYSGWSSNQLEDEMERHSWVSTPAPQNILGMEHDKSLWKKTLDIISPFHQLLALCPTHPHLN